MTIINSNPGRETLIPMSGLAMILVLSTFAVYAIIGGHNIETTSTILTYMVASLFGANALYRGFVETGPGGKFRRSYSFHKL